MLVAEIQASSMPLSGELLGAEPSGLGLLLMISLLVLVALAAGVIDAIAGGGGLITLPALLSMGLPPHLALGTNKGQSVFGAFAALLSYRRAGLIDGRRARLTFPAGLLGSLAGSSLVLALRPSILSPLVIILLVLAALVVALRRTRVEGDAAARPARASVPALLLIATGLGLYDGFFGPGTGTFLLIAFSTALRLPLREATAEAKVVNLASNLAALGVFALRDQVQWWVALPMGLAQLLGGTLGARLAVKRGAPLIRWVTVGVALALAARLSMQLLLTRP